MILSSLYRTITDWASRPVLTHDNENALWRMSAHDLSDLPIGPEPEDEGAAFEADRRDRCA
ncbi:hypothetical protein SAMN02745157_0519 [Kaistia soli DSM 19436]|uniref:Uncharacterized protein n=1 Tax=Kaistia soli DSM 19436 TaxID=1122133 RepID=A0A1M4URJ0_9HYPH|nr:hypothetical protein [Kaistia soli]SHE59314.1 hypothetical protein SAMN02745157_0519 [Kaistia soli DSM 19436]